MSSFDKADKAPSPPSMGNPPQQYDYAMPVQPGEMGGGGAASAGGNPTKGTEYSNSYNYNNYNYTNSGGGAANNSYNIDLGKQNIDLGSGPSNYQQYPEAEVNPVDLDAPSAEGTPLYPPEEVAANSELKRFRLNGCKDIWAGILFALFFLFTIIFGIVNMASYRLTPYDEPGRGDTPFEELKDRYSVGSLIAIFVISLVVSLAVAIICLFIAKMFPAKLIYVANIVIIAMYVASGILFATRKLWAGLVVMLVLAALQALWVFLVRSRIPFAAALLKTSCRILNAHKTLFLMNILLALSFFVFCIFWGFAMLRPTDRLSADKGNGGDGVLIAILALAFLWSAQVVTNVMHVTTAGVVATWYFAGAQSMPKNPTAASFKRAMTTSFGSICFGSLLVALIQFLRFLLESSRNGDNDNNFLRCIVDCMLRCLEGVVRYFNTYAFVHVAVYGCGYIEGAKRTFALCKQCFFSAYFNDCLVQPTLDMLALVAAVLIACIFGLVTTSWGVFLWVLVMAWIVHQLLFIAISSSITTLFVCFAEVPEALQRSDADLYAAIHAADGGAVHNGNAPPPNV